MRQSVKLLLVLMLAVPLMISAQRKDYSGEKGFVNFKDLTKYESTEQYAEIMLEDKLLKLASRFSKNEDPELAQLIENLKLVQVFLVGVDEENAKELKEKVNNINKSLLNNGWERIVKMKDRDEDVSVLISLESNSDINGLVVTSYDEDDEAAFVNIVGDIDLDTIGRLSNRWDIPHLDKVKQ